jgi:hypothetical protein
MRTFLYAALVTVIFASSALAQGAVNPLAPGKPAGVKEAQNGDTNPIVFVGLGLIAAGILIAASGDGHHHHGSSGTTTTTGTSP